MAFHGNVSKEVKAKLRKYWKESKKNRDTFRERVEADKSLTRVWSAYDNIARRLGLYKGAKPSSKKYPFSQLSEAERSELNELLATSGTIATQQKFPQFTPAQLRKYAGDHSISVKRSESDKLYDDRLEALIASGVLTAKEGVEGILAIIKREFPGVGETLDKNAILSKMEKIIWTSEADAALKKIVGHELPLSRFHQLHPHIPIKLIQERARFHSGLSNTRESIEFLTGFGRIGQIEDLDPKFQFPSSSYAKPYKISFNPDKDDILIINGPNVGTLHWRIIAENRIRMALAEAELKGDKAVIIINPIDIDTKKAAGSLKVLRAQVSGLNVNLDLLAPEYQAIAREIISGKNPTRFIYETTSEKIANVITGWNKIARKPEEKGGGPEYNGPVFILWGYKEEELAAGAAYWDLRYWTIVAFNELGVEVSIAKSALAWAKKTHQSADEINQLKKRLEESLNNRARTIISNISDEAQKAYLNKVRQFLARKFEEAIPNSKVIGQSTSFIDFGGEVVKFSIPRHMRVTDRLLADEVGTHGDLILLDQLPKTVVICHPLALNYRMTVRQRPENGDWGDTQFIVAPIAVDGEFLRNELKDAVRAAHPLSKCVGSSQFRSGVLRLSFRNRNVMPQSIPLDALARVQKSKTDSSDKIIASRYIWGECATDPHFGSRSKQEVYCQWRETFLGMSDAAIEMMRYAKLFNGDKMPVKFFVVNDDGVQGNHFDTHKQPDPLQMSLEQIEEYFNELKTESKKRGVDHDRILEQARVTTLFQLGVRGLDWLQPQIEVFMKRHVRNNLDFFDAVLRGALSSKLVLKGVSEHTGVRVDSRDAGFINFGTGNHIWKTTDENLTEGFLYAGKLRDLLMTLEQWRDKERELQKLVTSPLYSNQFAAWGTLKAPGGYEWALEFRDSPPKMSTWQDPLYGMVRNIGMMGDHTFIKVGRKTLSIVGDKHFYAEVDTDHTFFHMCGAGTHTDLFGYKYGLPPNNVGVSFIGLPVDGPDLAPILVRTLRYPMIRDFFKNPEKNKIDWADFLPNPV